MRSLVWFRRDLRVNDNHALHHAAKEADKGVIGLFIITPAQWREHDEAGCKVKFWLENLKKLSGELEKLNIPLRIETCDRFEDVPETLVKFANKHKCSALFFNREYEVNELNRDERVASKCEDEDIEVNQYHDRVIVPPCEITTNEGKFYSVFTPYRRSWEECALDFVDTLTRPKKQSDLDIKPSRIPASVDGFDFGNYREDLWTAGEKEAKKRLNKFIDQIDDYDEARDIPATEGTSMLSPYLAAGVISPRQCLEAAVASNNGKIDGKEGATTWISELAWRDFYTQVLVACPRVSKHQPFKAKTKDIDWREDEDDFEAWKEGKTGYPIVDAGMRQLNQMGWMHNRLRMVTAMFLSKNLLIDWRWGEKYFMQKLIDGDLASNNGGWQWSASTGTDAVPYFRIFNPFSQSKKYDADGEFIKEMCPELEDVPSKALHDEKKLTEAIEEHGVDYPEYVVDYKEGRERALDAFKSLD